MDSPTMRFQSTVVLLPNEGGVVAPGSDDAGCGAVRATLRATWPACPPHLPALGHGPSNASGPTRRNRHWRHYQDHRPLVAKGAAEPRALLGGGREPEG